MTESHLLKWVDEFMNRHGLYPSSGRAVVGLSGGMDSMLLAYTLLKISRGHLHHKEGGTKRGEKGLELHFVHIDHGLRRESSTQAKELQEMMAHWGVDLTILTFEKSDSPEKNRKEKKRTEKQRNIEFEARKKRHFLLKSFLKKGDVLYLAHHIDDSFEWFLRQLMGSSQSSFTMGIPLKNGPIRRPFHCLCRSQIKRFVRQLHLPFLVDDTNENLHFQRNQIRHLVKAPLLGIFPKGLAHYVHHANQWAQKREKKERGKGGELSSLPLRVDRRILGVSFIEKKVLKSSWRRGHHQIVAELIKLGKKSRGELRRNLEALYGALESSRGRRGPFFFSGGVQIYCYPELLVVLNERGRENLKRIDRFNAYRVDRFEKDTIGSQIPESVLPFILYKKRSKKEKQSKTIKGLRKDPLFPLTLESCARKGLSFRPHSFLSRLSPKEKGEIQVISFLFFEEREEIVVRKRGNLEI